MGDGLGQYNHCFYIILEIDPSLCPKTRKIFYNCMWIGKEEIEQSLLIVHVTVNLENTNSIDDLLKLRSQFSKFFGYKIIINYYTKDNCIPIHQQQVIRDYTFSKIQFIISRRKFKYLVVGLTKYVQDLYGEKL